MRYLLAPTLAGALSLLLFFMATALLNQLAIPILTFNLTADAIFAVVITAWFIGIAIAPAMVKVKKMVEDSLKLGETLENWIVKPMVAGLIGLLLYHIIQLILTRIGIPTINFEFTLSVGSIMGAIITIYLFGWLMDIAPKRLGEAIAQKR